MLKYYELMFNRTGFGRDPEKEKEMLSKFSELVHENNVVSKDENMISIFWI